MELNTTPLTNDEWLNANIGTLYCIQCGQTPITTGVMERADMVCPACKSEVEMVRYWIKKASQIGEHYLTDMAIARFIAERIGLPSYTVDEWFAEAEAAQCTICEKVRGGGE